VESSASGDARKRVSGDSFDLLFANLPQALMHLHHAYETDPEARDSRITILRIGDRALHAFARSRYPMLIEHLKQRFAQQMLFDVFISYAFKDEIRARSWKQQLESAGLRVYLSEPRLMHQFGREIEVALAESRVFVPIASRHSVKSKWVKDEIRRRKQMFDANPNILVLAIEDGLAEKLTSGISAVVVGEAGSEAERRAMDQAICVIRRVKEGGGTFPYSTSPSPEVQANIRSAS
jgi:hypothetical protein